MNQTDAGRALAAHISDTLFESHRGAFIRRDDLVVYGNDGYEKDELGRPRREIKAIIAWAKERWLEVTDFGTDQEGYSWALVCRGAHPDDLADLAVAAEDVLWDAWNGGQGDPLFQAFQMMEPMKAGEGPSGDDEPDLNRDVGGEG